MPTWDRSDPETRTREFLGTRVYMASHPRLRPHLRGSSRPSAFGDRIWPPTLTMIQYLDDRPASRVLEIGCGWGLLGVHLARRGAEVTCSDIDPGLEPIVAALAGLNQVHVGFRACALNDLEARDLEVDLVVGVEICYSAEVGRDLRALVARTPAEILVADPGRPDFLDLCDDAVARFGAVVTTLEKGTTLLSIPSRRRAPQSASKT